MPEGTMLSIPGGPATLRTELQAATNQAMHEQGRGMYPYMLNDQALLLYAIMEVCQTMAAEGRCECQGGHSSIRAF
eukprot:scaffold93076_cov16-Tisochrysis_lutea.AAC.1